MAFESVWAKGSSNSGGLSNIFTSSHLHLTPSNLQIFASSHPHIFFTSSHLHIFSSSSSHLHIFTSSHLLIFTSSHLHIFTSSHPLIFTSSHLHIFSSSHLLIFSSSHLLIFTSSHLLIFTSSHLHIFSSSHLHIFSSSHHISHLLIFTSSHLHIFTSSHLHVFTFHIFTFSLALLLSCPLALLAFYFSLEGAGQCQRDGTKRNFFRTKLRGSKAPKSANCNGSKCRNPFARNEVRSPKTEVKIAILQVSAATLSHEMRFDRQKLQCKSVLCVKVSVCKRVCV